MAQSLPTEFGSEGSARTKAWRDIWGSGQGIGAVSKVQPAKDYVDQLSREYARARARLCES
jgi:nitronate monooxygenase